jgi:hypothetical protein
MTIVDGAQITENLRTIPHSQPRRMEVSTQLVTHLQKIQRYSRQISMMTQRFTVMPQITATRPRMSWVKILSDFPRQLMESNNSVPMKGFSIRKVGLTQVNLRDGLQVPRQQVTQQIVAVQLSVAREFVRLLPAHETRVARIQGIGSF